MNNSPMHADPIDVPLLLERCMDDAALALMVLENFQGKAAGDLSEMAASVERGDSDAVARRAHALRGTAGAIAAGSLMDAASRLEEAACAKTLGDFRTLMGEVSSEMHRCVGALPTVRSALGRPGSSES